MNKSNRWMKVARCVAVTAAMVGLSGCAFLVGGAVGAGGMAYAKGDVRETVPASLDSVGASVKAVLAERKLTLKETATTTNGVVYAAALEGADVKAMDAARQKTSVACMSLGAASTEITVRAGTIGNEERGREILDAIKKGLK
jgi:hypothetical protein